MKPIYQNKGFTLVEILMVATIILVLSTIGVIALNPTRLMLNSRNNERSSDVSKILNIVWRYITEDENDINSLGTVPDCSTPLQIGTGSGNLNLKNLFVPSYIEKIPEDPISGTESDTGYTICITTNNEIQISAPNAEGGKVIEIKR